MNQKALWSCRSQDFSSLVQRTWRDPRSLWTKHQAWSTPQKITTSPFKDCTAASPCERGVEWGSLHLFHLWYQGWRDARVFVILQARQHIAVNSTLQFENFCGYASTKQDNTCLPGNARSSLPPQDSSKTINNEGPGWSNSTRTFAQDAFTYDTEQRV